MIATRPVDGDGKFRLELKANGRTERVRARAHHCSSVKIMDAVLGARDRLAAEQQHA